MQNQSDLKLPETNKMCKKGKIDWSVTGDSSMAGGTLLVAQQTKPSLRVRGQALSLHPTD